MICACLVPARGVGGLDATRLGGMRTDRRHGFDDHGLHPDGQQARARDHQRGAVPITGFAPERLTLAHIRVDLLQPAAFDHDGNDLFRGGAMQAFRQRHREIICALGCGAEDKALRVGEFGHCVSGPDRAARDCATFYRGKPATLAGRVVRTSSAYSAYSPSLNALSVMRFSSLA